MSWREVVCRDSSFLANRRVFAAADCGVPDGIKVDEAGNVWTGTGEGVAVYSSGPHSCFSPGTSWRGRSCMHEPASWNFSSHMTFVRVLSRLALC